MSFLDTIRREAAFLDGAVRSLWAYRNLNADGANTVADDLEPVIDRYADKDAFRFEGASLTYAAFEARANAFAHWALGQGVKRGDVVALFMTNRPDYAACWLGMAKIGAVTALINSNQTGAGLAHSLNISDADHVVVSEDIVPAYEAVAAQLTRSPKLWAAGGALDAALDGASKERPPASIREGMRSTDPALLVYTSGTTGLPKAARLTHLRTMGMMRAFIGGGHARASDRVYVTLPMYHATGGLTGVGFGLEVGATVILRRRFSASHFWEDVCKEEATVFFYVGELCRYLLNAAPDPLEARHKLRLAVGNGLRPEVWERFQKRFAIPRILEFYGSTEGNANILNFDGKVGSIGRIPDWARRMANVRIVKFDVETEEPVRGPDGLCIEAADDEAGEAIGEIRQNEARFKFEGYSGDKKQTEKKILRDVFAKGDAWFRTGDLLRRDKDGYFYFVDRIGDTFRWKGENVSTNEVADVLATIPGVAEANVYGVKVGDLDGRAGMAALTPGPGFDLARVREAVVRELPAYARPVFIRLQAAIETTGTFKYRKVDLVREGFDPAAVGDDLYLDDPGADAYVPLTPELFADVQSGARRL